MVGWSISRTDMASPAIMTSPTSRFGTRRISFIPIVADWIGAGGKIGGVVLNDGKWFNIGSRTQYLEIHRVIADGWRPRYVEKREWPIRVAKGAIVATSARLSGFFSIGNDCSVGDDAIIE